MVTALKLLDIIADIQNGSLLLQTTDGYRLLDGLNQTVSHIQQMPEQLTRFVIELISKIFTLAQGNSSTLTAEALDRVKMCGQQMIAIARVSTVELVKNPLVSLAQADIYQSILYTVVLAMNCFGLEIDPESNEKDDQTDVRTISIESSHPFTDFTDELVEVVVPGSPKKSYLSFHSDTSVDPNIDFVRFYRDESRTAYWGEPLYTMTLGLPGMRGLPCLEIPSGRFFVQVIQIYSMIFFPKINHSTKY